MSSEPPRGPIASVVVPAHNEARTIGRLLDALKSGIHDGILEVIVVPNGCTDQTAGIAAEAGATVVELEEGNKPAALNAGDAMASASPRFYVDADIVLTTDDIVRMAAVLNDGVPAVAPSRRLLADDSSAFVRSYLRIWDQLPSVRRSLAGRGCFGVSATGRSRWDAFPELVADDAFVNSLFAPDERPNLEDVTSLVIAPATARAVVQRKRRTHRGNRELAQAGTSVAAPREWLGVVRRDRQRLIDVPAFLIITVIGRLVARWDERRGSTQWTTDTTSRG